MAKKQKQHTKTCAECIHESSCRMWTDGRYISDASANQYPNHETVKESGAYLCGVLDEKKRKQTNTDRIRAMSDEELTDAIYRLIHANDPALWFCKGTKECGELMDNDEEIPEEMCRKCLLEKLQQPAEEG